MHQYRLRSRMGLKDLPPELLLKVHRLLPLRDLKSAVLANKTWNQVGEDPDLWSRSVVRIGTREDTANISIRRLARLQEIEITQGNNLANADWEVFFRNVEKLDQLKNICGLGSQDLRAVESGVLVGALFGVEKVDLWNAHLTSNQLTYFFGHLAMRDSKMKKLLLGGQDLSDVPMDDLAAAVNKLEIVELMSTGMTTGQLTSILKHTGDIMDKDIKLKVLRLLGNDMSGVEPYDLAVGVSKVEEVNLCFTRLSTRQLTSILRLIMDKDIKLKQLMLQGNDMSGVDKDLLMRANDKLFELGGGIFH